MQPLRCWRDGFDAKDSPPSTHAPSLAHDLPSDTSGQVSVPAPLSEMWFVTIGILG